MAIGGVIWLRLARSPATASFLSHGQRIWLVNRCGFALPVACVCSCSGPRHLELRHTRLQIASAAD